MARSKTPTLTDGELRIMEVLWDRGEATVKDVQQALARDHGVAYSTVQTMLRILDEKRYVHYRKEGRAFVYSPLVGREQARATALRHLIRRFFGDSPQALAQALVADEDVDLLELQKLREEVERDGGDKETDR